MNALQARVLAEMEAVSAARHEEEERASKALEASVVLERPDGTLEDLPEGTVVRFYTGPTEQEYVTARSAEAPEGNGLEVRRLGYARPVAAFPTGAAGSLLVLQVGT